MFGQITWLHTNFRHLDHLQPFLGHSGPQIPNLGVPFLANFFLQNISMWGVQSDAMWCLVFLQPFQMQGTHSEAQNGQKVNFTAIMDPVSHFLVPHFRPIFFLFKIWACGVSRAMPCDTRSFCNLFKRKGTHSEAQNGEKVIFTVILDLKSQFFGHYEPLIGSLGFEKVA